MPPFADLDRFEAPYPRGLSVLCNPLAGEPMSIRHAADEHAKRHRCFTRGIEPMNHTPAPFEARRAFDVVAHRTATLVGGSDLAPSEYDRTGKEFKIANPLDFEGAPV